GVEDDFTTAAAGLERLQSITGGTLATLQIDQLVTCGRTVGAFLSDPNSEGALAVMLRADPHGDIESLTAVWSPTPVVLSP
ncbi:MAG TPA: hypothetical protein VGB85_19845, partial [Nannocystis sp.]